MRIWSPSGVEQVEVGVGLDAAGDEQRARERERGSPASPRRRPMEEIGVHRAFLDQCGREEALWPRSCSEKRANVLTDLLRDRRGRLLTVERDDALRLPPRERPVRSVDARA